MKHVVYILGGQELNRRARRDGREARGNEEREKREDWEREPLFLQVLRVWQVGAQASKFGFYKLKNALLKKKCHGVKQNAKICAIGKQNVANKNWSLYLRRTKNWSEENEGMVEREGWEREQRENLKRRIRNIDTCLCLLFSFLKAFSPEFPTRFCSKGCSNEVLDSSGASR